MAEAILFTLCSVVGILAATVLHIVTFDVSTHAGLILVCVELMAVCFGGCAALMWSNR